MTSPGSLLKTTQNCMISFVLSYDALKTQEMSLDISLVSGDSELFTGCPLISVVEIASGDDLAQS